MGQISVQTCTDNFTQNGRSIIFGGQRLSDLVGIRLAVLHPVGKTSVCVDLGMFPIAYIHGPNICTKMYGRVHATPIPPVFVVHRHLLCYIQNDTINNVV